MLGTQQTKPASGFLVQRGEALDKEGQKLTGPCKGGPTRLPKHGSPKGPTARFTSAFAQPQVSVFQGP